jgi:hypothetical protein
MGSRVQVILDDEDREAFRRQAEREGLSLSAWLREAGRRRLAERAQPRIDDVASLKAFFAGLPDRDTADGEPSWEEHLAVIEESRRAGLASG